MNPNVKTEPMDSKEIDFNKLNELNEVASNYLDDFNNQLGDQNYGNFEENNKNNPNYQNYDYNSNNPQLNYDNIDRGNTNSKIQKEKSYNFGSPIRDNLPSMSMQNLQLIKEENEKLKNKIHQYQKINREWELKVNNIKQSLNQMEARNNYYKEEAEKSKDEKDQCQFKLNLLLEKEKNHDDNMKQLKELENKYETNSSELKKDFKNKEENLKKKYEKLEEIFREKLKIQEDEFNEKLEKLNNHIDLLQKSNDQLENECDYLRDKLVQSENFFQLKENEFNEIVMNKDRKMKDLEISIRSISEEANSQINKLSECVNEFNDKINYYKQREKQIMEQLRNLKNNKNQNDAQLNDFMTKEPGENENYNIKYNNKIKLNNSITSGEFNVNTEPSISNNKEFFRKRIKDLEEENMAIARELNLKYDESEALNNELREAYDRIKTTELNMQMMIRSKEDEITNLTNKINQLDITIGKYGNNLSNIKNAYDKISQDHKKEISSKNEEISNMREKYEKKITDLQNKIDEVLRRDNVFIQNMNKNNLDFSSNSRKVILPNQSPYINTPSRNQYIYTPIQIPDDEGVRRNISDQINYIKDKLDSNFYS